MQKKEKKKRAKKGRGENALTALTIYKKSKVSFTPGKRLNATKKNRRKRNQNLWLGEKGGRGPTVSKRNQEEHV